jgi:hypothetical protein
VKLGVAATQFAVWKVWESGTPELAVEIASPSESESWDDKLAKYHELGVQELVRFDATAESGARVRVWDRIDDDLVERTVKGDTTPCTTLALHWVVRPAKDLSHALRLARDADGNDVLPTPFEAEARAREGAERRIAELEAEVRRLKG